MEKKPNLFVNKVDKKFSNNERVYYSDKESVITPKKSKSNKTTVSLTEKINSIFTSSNYVYKAEVKIKLKDKDIIKKIVGKNQQHLITMDNELIPIVDIVDIEMI